MIVALLSLLADTGSAVALEACPRGGKDVVICGSRGAISPYRLPKLPERYERKPLRAEANIGGAKAAARVTSTTRQDGWQDNRLMVTFSTAF